MEKRYNTGRTVWGRIQNLIKFVLKLKVWHVRNYRGEVRYKKRNDGGGFKEEFVGLGGGELWGQ